LILLVQALIFFIFSTNFISILLGWDGLGLVSYLLISYYYSYYAINSSLITLVSNRFGDLNLLAIIVLLFDMNIWTYHCFLHSKTSYFLITAIFTKSAQIPFSAWLPQAIAAPTPVSSLVHSSTLVTAGIYLGMRNYSFISVKLIQIISSRTLLIASFLAIWETDFKKIIALSTLSQIALIILSLSLLHSNLTFFHLVSHAIFKCLLFLSRGILLHSIFRIQDIRILQFFSSKPINLQFFLIRNLSLMGFPFLCGFYRKDLIYENIINFNFWLRIILIFRILCTVIYTVKSSITLIQLKSNNVWLIVTDYKKIRYASIFLWVLMFYFSYLNWFFMINYWYFYKIKNFYKTVPLIVLIYGTFLGFRLKKINFFHPRMLGLIPFTSFRVLMVQNKFFVFFNLELSLLYKIASFNTFFIRIVKYKLNINLAHSFILVFFWISLLLLV